MVEKKKSKEEIEAIKKAKSEELEKTFADELATKKSKSAGAK
jgi:hypothetical protein